MNGISRRQEEMAKGVRRAERKRYRTQHTRGGEALLRAEAKGRYRAPREENATAET